MRLADYEIIETIGTHGERAYHKAKPPARLGLNDPIVTLRVLDQFGTREEFERVSGELRLLHSLGSPHLVELVDAGLVDGKMYVATRHYPGGSLQTSAPGLPRSSRVSIVADAARGAHAMHEVGMAHRDIKPANIFVDRQRGRLADLGQAQTMAGTTTSIGAGQTASLEFIDPDLVSEGRASRATDIWSLGLTVHAVVSDVAPYEIPSDGLMAAFRHVMQNRPTVDDTLEPELRRVIEGCLTPEAERFDTALDLAMELDAVSSQLADAESRAPNEPEPKGQP